jgi:hypothetical protein
MIKIDEKVTVRNGNLMRVYNTERKTNANKFYWFMYVQMPDGTEVPVMLTEKQLENIKNRAAKNEEDTPKKNFFVDLSD